MITIGITGSIGMGKSTVASQFALLGAKICKADTLVHALLGPGGKAVEAVAKSFPETRQNDAISRALLGRRVFGDAEALHMLEALLHPLVQQEEARFIERQRHLGARAVALDIPLLFETNSEHRFDCTVAVTAPAFLQRQRVLRRPGMTREKLEAILARQMPDREKRSRADFVIHTGLGKAYSFVQVKHMLMMVK